MSFDLIRGQLASDVAANGTFTVAYPTNRQAGDYYKAIGHRLTLQTVPTGSLTTPNTGGNDGLSYPIQFGVTLNSVATGTVTITNKTTATWRAGTFYTVRLERLGSSDYRLGLPGTSSPLFAYGAAMGRTILVNFGAPKAPVTNYFATAQAVAGAGNLTITTTLTLDRPRNVTATSSSASDTANTVTVTGTDIYGVAMTETIAFAGAATIQGKKAFKTVSRFAMSGSAVGNISAGYGDVLGFPVFIPETGFVIAQLENGASAAGTLVAGDQTAGGATATTGDIRGTWDPSSATNDSIVFQCLVFLPDPGYQGTVQA